MQSMKTNWKTTALGICGLLTSVGLLGTDVLQGNYNTISVHIPAIATSLGLLFAKDAPS